MRHPLEKRIAALRRAVRSLVLIRGLSWVAALALTTALLLGLLDFLIHFEDRGLRILATLTVVGVLGWTTYRFLLRGLLARVSDLNLAIRFERRYPDLNDRLTSALQFLYESEDDPQAGSAALRRAVIVEATAELDRLRLAEVINPRPVVRVGLAALALVLVAAILTFLDAPSVGIAVARLANPLGDRNWPQRHHLKLRGPLPTRVAREQSLLIAVVDANGVSLPEEVRLHVRYEGAESEDVVKMRFAGGEMIHRFASVTRPFAFRAAGGDDNSMAWTRIEVVEPPVVETLTVTLHAPAYTAWPSTTTDKHIRALKGTRVELRGSSTKPLAAATVVLEDGAEFPAQVSDDGEHFHLSAAGESPLIVEKSGAYWLRLEDREGFRSSESQSRYEIRCLSDLPPGVTFDKPMSDSFVTPEAVVPLVIAVKDDLLIKDVRLQFSRSDASEEDESTLLLYSGPAEPPLQPKGLATPDLGDRRIVQHRWDLSKLKLPRGTQVTFYAASSDYLPQQGQSHSRRLTIISPEELHDRIAQRQGFILAELARVLKLQRQSRSQLSDVQIQHHDVGRIGKRDVDRLQGAELTQRQVDRALTNTSEGVPSTIHQLLADLKNNNIDSPETERRMQGLLDEIGELARQQLPAIAAALTSAIKRTQSRLADDDGKHPDGAPTDPQIGEALDDAGSRQDDVIAVLETMLGDLSQWDNYRRFFREISGMRREHDDIAGETARLAGETLTKDFKDLTRQQQADLKKASGRMRELARRMDLAQQNMDQMTQSLADSDPLAAGVLSDAVHRARSAGLSNQMRDAARNLKDNQLGRAAGRQKSISAELKEMLNILANRREHELSRLVKKLREAETELQDLRRRQAGLRKKMSQAQAVADPKKRRRELQRLAREQEQLKQDADRFARKLQRLQAEKASRSAAGASRQMGQAGQKGEQGDAAGAQDAAQQAEKDLDEAQQQLEQRRQQAEQDLAVEQLAKIQDALESMTARQQQVLDETIRLAGLLEQVGRLTRGQAISLRDLSRQQADLEQEIREMAEKLTAAEVFNLALDGAADQMQIAAGLLAKRQVGQPAQDAEQNALRRLNQLLESLKPEKPKKGEDGNNSGGQGGAGRSGGDGIPALAQLKLLKLRETQKPQQSSG